MPLDSDEKKGTTKSAGQSEEYCVYCMKDGEFTQEITLEQAIVQCVEHADMAGATKAEALEYAKATFPTLRVCRFAE